jgi:hypothetical protein
MGLGGIMGGARVVTSFPFFISLLFFLPILFGKGGLGRGLFGGSKLRVGRLELLDIYINAIKN